MPWILCLLSGVLLYMAPQFSARPWLVISGIVCIAAADFFLVSLFARGRSPGFFRFQVLSGSRAARAFQFLPAFLPLLWIPAGFYFSDDAVRHIQDGVQILKGVDVYAVPAGRLSNPIGLTANQPQLGSIYLPTIQLLSVLGAMANGVWGFRIFYALAATALSVWVTAKLPNRHRGWFVWALMSPLWVIISASRHSDGIGALLILTAVVAVRKKGKAGLFFGGMACVAAIGAKPEGMVFGAAIAGALLLGLRPWRDLGWFLAGALIAVVGLGFFSREFLFHSAESIQGFRGALDFYVRQLLAYHPLGLLRHSWGWSVDAVNVRIREEGAGIFIGILGALPALYIATRSRPALRSPRRLMRLLLPPMVIGVLLGMFAMRPVWQPWHFLWILVALGWAGRAKTARICLPILLLMYSAVPFYRAGGAWSDGLFWQFGGVFALAGVVWFWLTKCRRWFLSY